MNQEKKNDGPARSLLENLAMILKSILSILDLVDKGDE